MTERNRNTCSYELGTEVVDMSMKGEEKNFGTNEDGFVPLSHLSTSVAPIPGQGMTLLSW